MKVRTAFLPEESKQLSDFINAHWDEAANTFSSSNELHPGNKAAQVMCAEENGHILGVAVWYDSNINEPTLFLSKLVVHQQRRGEGIARLLLDEFTKSAQERNLTCMLRVNRNSSDTIKLYKKFGFRIMRGELKTPGTYIFMKRPAPDANALSCP